MKVRNYETEIPPSLLQLHDSSQGIYAKSSLPDGGFIELGEILAGISSAPAEVSALTPYLFVLFETENGAASWQYLDLAGETKRILSQTKKVTSHAKK